MNLQLFLFIYAKVQQCDASKNCSTMQTVKNPKYLALALQKHKGIYGTMNLEEIMTRGKVLVQIQNTSIGCGEISEFTAGY